MRDTIAELAERAQLISQEAGSKVAAAMKDVISAGAGITGFAIESARDLVQYMVKRGQMTPEEGDKLIREAEAAHDKRPDSEKARPTASKIAAERAAAAKAEAAARAAAQPAHHPFRAGARPVVPPAGTENASPVAKRPTDKPAATEAKPLKATKTPKEAKEPPKAAKAGKAAKAAAKSVKPAEKPAAKPPKATPAPKSAKAAKPAKKSGKR